MSARGRRIITPAWVTALAEKVWQAEMGEPFVLPIRFKDRSHIRGLGGIGVQGQARNRFGQHFEIWVETGRQSTKRWTKIVLLHELTHAMLPVTVNHTSVFYARLFPVYEKYLTADELRDAVQHELGYMPKGATSVVRSRPTLRKYM